LELLRMKLGEEGDIIIARIRAGDIAKNLGFNYMDKTRIATAVSEIARNAIQHGGGGEMVVNKLDASRGIEIQVSDRGPGIPDINRALAGGYATGAGLGLGLSGSKKLMDEFEIISEAGKGTKVIMRKLLKR